MSNLIDCYYFPLPTQGNIFSSVKFQMSDGSTRILVGVLDCKIYLIQFHKRITDLEPQIRELCVPNIPPDAVITTVDILNRSESTDDFIIGIIFSEIIEGNINASLSFYAVNDLQSSIDETLVDEPIYNTSEKGLKFIPYGLKHFQISPHQIDGEYRNLWLLPGNDNQIHAYTTDDFNNEIDIANYFIEFKNPKNIVFTIDIFYYNNYHSRISAFGCENGYVRCFVVDCDNNTILKNFTKDHYAYPVSNVLFFTYNLPNQDNISAEVDKDISFINEKGINVNLLVTNTIYHSEVFMDVLNKELNKKYCLVESSQFNICLCSFAADIDFDSNKELILGTYGQKLLFFKYEHDNWNMYDVKPVNSPVYKLFYEDLTGDGVSDLITVTSKGVNIYQHDIKKSIIPLLEKRLKKMDE